MKLGELVRKPIIYLDMDEVIANFKKRAKEVLGTEKFNGTQEEWDKLKEQPHIYAELEKLEDADHLVAEVKKLAKTYGYDVQILTAIPRMTTMPHAEVDKRKWIEKHFKGLHVKIGPFSRDKWKHAKDGDILIDDRKSNIKEWQKNAGQFAILHKNAVDSLALLRNYLANKS